MDLLLVDNEITSREIKVGRGETLNVNLAMFERFSTCGLKIFVEEGANLNVALADFSNGSGKFEAEIHLKEGSTCAFHGAVLTKGFDRKTYDVSIYHEGPNSEALVSTHGIAREQSRLVIEGVSDIKKGSIGAKTRQEGRVIVFDPRAVGDVSPSLLIDENDVEASHAATVGRLNEDHLFYLLSRGLSLVEAKRLITLGYLKPIASFFNDEAIKEKIDLAIEGSFDV